MELLNTEVKIANLVSKIFPNVTVRRSGDEYIFTLDCFHNSAQPAYLIDFLSDKDIPIIAEGVAIDFSN